MAKSQPMTEPQEPRAVRGDSPEKPTAKPMTVLEQVKPRSVPNPDLKEPPKGQGMNDPMEVRSVRNDVSEGKPLKLKVKEGWQIKHGGKVRRGGETLEDVPATRAQHYLSVGWAEEVTEKAAPAQKKPAAE